MSSWLTCTTVKAGTMVVFFLRALVTTYTGTTPYLPKLLGLQLSGTMRIVMVSPTAWMRKAIRLLYGFMMPVASDEGSN